MSTNATAVASEDGGGPHRSLLLSLIATASVAVIPTFFAFAVFVFSRQEPMLLAAVGVSIVLTAGAVVAGSALWARQPESAGVSFGDLMLWSWIRQHQAERTLQDATATLGFDRYGNFLGHSTASEEQQVHAMRAIAKALDSKSTYTLGHSARVAKHAHRVARKLDLPEERAVALVLAAELHDLGNISLPDEILRKAGELTVEERSEIEGHVLLGARMVEQAGSPEVVEGIKFHHERWDGRGYPEGLSGARIPTFAGVIAIAEAYDAMTSTRPYRQSFSKQHAIDVLRAEAGSQFDGDLVEAFIATLRKPSAFVNGLPLLAAIQGQARELFLVFKRIGAVAVSATASTIAIALILGGSTLSPGTWDRIAPDFLDRRGDQRVQPINNVLSKEVENADDDAPIIGTAEDPTGTVVEQSSDDVLGVRFERFSEDTSVTGTIAGAATLDGGGSDGDGKSPDGGGKDPKEEPPPPGTDPDDGGSEEPPPEEPAPDPEPEPEPEPDEDEDKPRGKPDKDEGKPQGKPDKEDGKR